MEPRGQGVVTLQQPMRVKEAGALAEEQAELGKAQHWRAACRGKAPAHLGTTVLLEGNICLSPYWTGQGPEEALLRRPGGICPALPQLCPHCWAGHPKGRLRCPATRGSLLTKHSYHLRQCNLPSWGLRASPVGFSSSVTAAV